MRKPVTLVDVAREASVSAMTASNALNGRPGVSPKTRDRVRDAARRLNYVPNFAARGLAGGRTGMIGVLINDLTVQWATEVVTGVADVLSEGKRELLISATYHDSGREAQRLAFLSRGLVDGLLLISPVLEVQTLEMAQQLNVPVVVVDPRRFQTPLPHVTVDNFGGAYAATAHLLELGHRRIAAIAGASTFDSSHARIDGYAHALKSFTASNVEPVVVGSDWTQATARSAVTELLSGPDRPTALFATSDLAAIGAIDAARSLGLHVPDELSVVGFDDIPSASSLFPALTTVHQPLRRMGQVSAEMLLGALENSSSPAQSVVLPTRLVIRASTQAIQRVDVTSGAPP